MLSRRCWHGRPFSSGWSWTTPGNFSRIMIRRCWLWPFCDRLYWCMLMLIIDSRCQQERCCLLEPARGMLHEGLVLRMQDGAHGGLHHPGHTCLCSRTQPCESLEASDGPLVPGASRSALRDCQECLRGLQTSVSWHQEQRGSCPVSDPGAQYPENFRNCGFDTCATPPQRVGSKCRPRLGTVRCT